MFSRSKNLVELAKKHLEDNAESSEEECDDSDRDKDFVPGQEISDESDSDHELIQCHKIQKVKRDLMHSLSKSSSFYVNDRLHGHARNSNFISPLLPISTNVEYENVEFVENQESFISKNECGKTISNKLNDTQVQINHVESENLENEIGQNKSNFVEDIEQSVNNNEIDTEDNVERENLEIGNTQGIKRKRPRTIEDRMLNLKKKHPLRAPSCNCKEKKCKSNISKEERNKIYEEFWSLTKHEQRIWLSTHVREIRAKRKVEGSRRNFSRSYVLGDENSPSVCQQFFLSSIGYTSTTIIDVMLKACKDENGNRRLLPKVDQRGRHEPANKVRETPIKEHINSFKPVHSHYRRYHAPNRRYLPADLSIKTMYELYLSNPQHKKVSYEVYRRNLDAMNIGFYEVGADKCGYCIEMDKNPTEENLNLKMKHLEEVKKTRDKYRADGELANQNRSIRVFAADLQKVFLLPRMPKVKDSFFTSRLIVFNETSAALSKNGEHFCILWHEAIAGRHAEDVACTFIKILELNRDAESIIFWLDNCTGQNKNSIFFSSLLTYVNCEFCTISSISINYLVSGHSYMAVDGLHGKIEQVVRKTGDVEDFNDFVNCCQKASKRIKTLSMQCTDFMKFENKFKAFNRKSDNNGIPYFKDIVSVKFVRGCTELFYKTNFDETEYKVANDILKKKAVLELPPRTQLPRGISKTKKDAIVKSLVCT